MGENNVRVPARELCNRGPRIQERNTRSRMGERISRIALRSNGGKTISMRMLALIVGMVDPQQTTYVPADVRNVRTGI